MSRHRSLYARFAHLLAVAMVLGFGGVGCTAPEATPPPAAVVEPPELTETQMAQIDEITGAKGSHTPEEDVYKVTFPRTEVPTKVDGWPFQPFMGITSWAAFTPQSENEVMVMGDLTLYEDEVNPVMSVALENGLEVTALHNHFLYDQPKVMFMHIGGHGSVESLATAVRKSLDEVAAVRKTSPAPASAFPGTAIPETSSITAETIDNILGVNGTVKDGMYKAVIGRTATMHGREIGTQMGVNTWAAFAGSDAAAFVDGDFAMLEGEVQNVLKALRRAGIKIVAIHNHMIHDEPRYVFLHYWGKGSIEELARGVKSGLDVLGEPQP